MLGVDHELRLGLRDPLALPQKCQVSFQVARGPSGFLSSRCREWGRVWSSVGKLSVPLRQRPGSWASYQGSTRESGLVWFEALNSAFLSRCQRGVRLPVEFRWGIWAFSRQYAGRTGLPSCCEGILGVPLEPVQGTQDLSGTDGQLSVLFPCSRIRGVPLEFQLVTQATFCGSREVGIPLELKQGMGPHLQMRWETRCSSRVALGNSAFISSFDGDLWAPLS